MIQVKPGQNIPLSYVFPTAATPRVVKATLEKMSGAVLATITLTEVHPGDHQNQSFPMPVGIDFLKARLIPYLADGTTPDTANPITQEIYATVTPILVSRMNVRVGCEDQPTQRPVITSQNSNPSVLMAFQDDNGNPLDTSAASFVALRIKKGLARNQVDTISVSTLLSGHVYSFQVNYVDVSYTALLADAEQDVLAGLLAAMVLAFSSPASPPVTGVVTGTGPGSVLTLTAVAPGDDVVYSAVDADLLLTNVVTNTLEKNITNGITAVAGQQGQYLVQFTAQDISKLPTGDVDAAAVLTQSGETLVTNVYDAMTIQSDILSD